MTRTNGFRAAAATAVLLFAAACDRGPSAPAPAGSAPDETEPAPDAAPERVIARVNGEPLTARALEGVWEAERLRLGAAGDNLSPEQELRLRRSALELLIQGELVYQAARASGIAVTDQEIGEQLRVARSQFPTDEEFQAYLERAGMTVEALRRQEERRLLMQRYVEQVTQSLDLDETAARRMYEADPERFSEPEQIRAAQILVRVAPGASDDERRAARARIDEAHRRAVAGEDFAALARQYSDSPLAADGGDLGFFPRGRMIESFDRVAFATPVGSVSDVFETPHGYNVVKVLDRKPPTVRPFEEVKGSLLMVLAREQQDAALEQRVRELRAKADVEIVDPELREAPGA